MTDQQTDLGRLEDGYDAGQYAADDYAETQYIDDGYDESEYAHGYDDPKFGDSLDPWADDWDGSEWDGIRPRPAAPPQVSRPWYRDPRWLFALIALAAAALVVATVLLVTGRNSGEIPTAPALTTRTPASSTSTPSPRNAIPSASTSAPSTTPASSTPEEANAVDIPAPVEVTATAEPPAEAPAPSQSQSPAGPRINVTRTPMSFSPGKH